MDFERLVNWVEGRLSDEESLQVAAEVAADKVLQAEVEWLRRFYQSSQT